MVSKQDVLDAVSSYGKRLGEKRVKQLMVSDEWSDALTMVVLLLKNPGLYQGRLDEQATREAVYQKVSLLVAREPV